MLGVSRRELARRLGVTENAVRKALKSGRIAALPDGTIDPDKATAAWTANSDPARSRVRAPVRTVRTDAVQTEFDAADAVTLVRRVLQEEGAEANGPVTFDMARTADLIIKARERQLNMDTKAGKLLEAEAVERVWSDEWRQVRSSMLALPSRIRQLLGHLTVHDVSTIDRAIRDALADLGRGGNGICAAGPQDTDPTPAVDPVGVGGSQRPAP